MHPASLILAIAIPVTLAFKVHAADDTFACLDQLSGPIETIRGDRGYSNFWRNAGDASWPKDQRFDAQGASWNHQTVPTHKPDNPWLIILGGGWRAPIKERMCWAGGRIMGTNPDNATYRDVKNEAGDGLQFNSKSGTVDGIRIHKAAETGLSIIYGDNFTVKNVWMSHQKANCIENDHLGAGLIDDVLLDGCFDVFSIDPDAKYKGKNRSDRVVTINNYLFREHKVEAPRENSLGCGVIIKTKPTSQSLRIYNSIFALECWSPEKFKVGAGGPPIAYVEPSNAHWIAKQRDRLAFRRFSSVEFSDAAFLLPDREGTRSP